MATKAEPQNGFVETIKTIVWALLIAGVFRTLFFQPFWIPSGSMKDTLLIGDFLFVNKMAYGYSQYSCPLGLCSFINDRILANEPERGDIIVFRHPVNGADFIKRLVGLPGDRVQMINGVLHVNGSAAPQRDDGVFEEVFAPQGPAGNLPLCENAGVGIGGVCVKNKFAEQLPGTTFQHSVLDARRSRLDDTPVYTVPDGHYFFVGDNRDNSTDSRVLPPNGVGFVPFENLIGRADRVMFSAGGRSLFFVWTWRADRFFKRLI